MMLPSLDSVSLILLDGERTSLETPSKVRLSLILGIRQERMPSSVVTVDAQVDADEVRAGETGAPQSEDTLLYRGKAILACELGEDYDPTEHQQEIMEAVWPVLRTELVGHALRLGFSDIKALPLGLARRMAPAGQDSGARGGQGE